MELIDAEVVLKDIEDLRMSPWHNAIYLSEQRQLGIKEGLDMVEACVRYATEVEAIPISWIEQYGEENWFDYGTQYNAITEMLKAWERENNDK